MVGTATRTGAGRAHSSEARAVALVLRGRRHGADQLRSADPDRLRTVVGALEDEVRVLDRVRLAALAGTGSRPAVELLRDRSLRGRLGQGRCGRRVGRRGDESGQGDHRSGGSQVAGAHRLDVDVAELDPGAVVPVRALGADRAGQRVSRDGVGGGSGVRHV